jgi:hypothetical protein
MFARRLSIQQIEGVEGDLGFAMLACQESSRIMLRISDSLL